jgi:hypothetical protein
MFGNPENQTVFEYRYVPYYVPVNNRYHAKIISIKLLGSSITSAFLTPLNGG